MEEDGGLNLYGMCYNNPVNWFDPDGRAPMSWPVMPPPGYPPSMPPGGYGPGPTTEDLIVIAMVATILSPIPGDEVGLAAALGVKMGSKCCRGVKVAVEKTYKALKPNPVDPNKLNHIFGKAQHNLDDLLNNAFGENQEKAFRWRLL